MCASPPYLALKCIFLLFMIISSFSVSFQYTTPSFLLEIGSWPSAQRSTSTERSLSILTLFTSSSSSFRSVAVLLIEPMVGACCLHVSADRESFDIKNAIRKQVSVRGFHYQLSNVEIPSYMLLYVLLFCMSVTLEALLFLHCVNQGSAFSLSLPQL